MAIDTEIIKKKLEEEKGRLEKELSTVAHEKKEGGAWEAMGTLVDESDQADPNDVADKIEEFETNQAITESFKEELREVNQALLKIEAGTYGVCEICGKPIEENRLEANTSARTCIADMNHIL